MKILHLIYDHVKNPWVGGGGAVRAWEIYRRLAKKGHSVTIVSGNYPDARDYSQEGVNFKFVGSAKNYYISTFSYQWMARNYLWQNFSEYDLIVEDFAPWNPLFSYRLQDKVTVVLQVHQKEGINIFRRYFIFGLPFIAVESLYPKKFKNVITVSEICKKAFNLNNAEIISNGIPEEFLNIASTNGDYCLFMGRIDFYHKGIDIILKAFKNLNIPLLIAGSGKDQKSLRKALKKIKNVQYIGRVVGNNKIEVIKNAKFLIMPSRYEAQGIVALESAALGKPLIVSDIPALNYVVENGFGISFKSEDAEDFKNKVLILWNNDELLQNLSKNARNYAKDFTWEKIAEQFENYLYRILND